MGCARGATDTSLSRRLHQWILVPKTPFGGGRRILAWGDYLGFERIVWGNGGGKGRFAGRTTIPKGEVGVAAPLTLARPIVGVTALLKAAKSPWPDPPPGA
jgi:hypothetical protein